MTKLLISFIISLVGTIVFGYLLLPLLRHLKFGQKILEEGPNWQMKKQGTPTMGGFFFMAAISVAVVIAGWKNMLNGEYAHLFVLAFSLIFGIIGFIDDFHKVKKKQNQGLTSIQKLLLQLAVAAAFIALMRFFGYLSPDLFIPFFGITLPLNLCVFSVVTLIVMAGMVNAVNLTDGIDGLCSGVMTPIACFFAVVGYMYNVETLSIFSVALAGAMIGFLHFNFHPAKVFMGDTGSLFLGGALCGMGFLSGVPLLVIIVGAVYIFEMLSVVLQVTYFKLSKGKRIFKMSPFHHHLEMSGWKEKKIFIVMVGITVLMCVAAWFGIAVRMRF